ncbi:MAG: hypothetical protein ACKVS8_06440 [Phycisphaerales bacterium]
MPTPTRTLSAAAAVVAIAGCAASLLARGAGEPPVTDDSVDHMPHRRLADFAVGSAASDSVAQSVVQGAIFAILAPNQAGGSRGNSGSSVAVDVGRFARACETYPNPGSITGIDIGWIAFNPPIPGDFDYQVLFYQDTIEIDAPVATGTPFYQNLVPNSGFRLDGLTPTYNSVEWFGIFLDVNPPLVFDPTKTFAYEVRIFQAGTQQMWPGNAASTSVIVPLIRPFGASVGMADVRRWNDPTFSLDGTKPVDFSNGFPADFAATNRRDVYLKLAADTIVPIPPPTSGDLGCTGPCDSDTPPASYDCADPHPSFDLIVPPSRAGMATYRLTLGRPISRDDDTFLDVRLDRDLGTGIDVPSSLALYNADGDLMASDIGEGGGGGGDIETEAPGLYGMLSFGSGRRPAQPGGYAFDGRDGELPAGVYFIVVSAPTALYSPHLSHIDPNDPLSQHCGTVHMVVTSNIGSPANCANTPIAPPQVRSYDVLGDLPGGVTTMDVVRTGNSLVRWVRFDLPPERAVTPGGSNFIDINQNGTLAVDGALGLYDNAGNLLAFDLASGQSTGPGARLGQLSFGGAAAGARPADGDGQPYANSSGNSLPPGTYWLAVGRDADSTPSEMRFDPTGWRAYSAGQPFASVTVNIRAETGCTVEYNLDGSLNPDDLGDFITDYYTVPHLSGPGGYAIPCPENAAPYDAGYKAAYLSTGEGQCTPPMADNLGDYITDYFQGC